MRPVLAAAVFALLLAGCATAGKADKAGADFDFDRYVPSRLGQVEGSSEEGCQALPDRPIYMVDALLPAHRFEARATQRFRPLEADARKLLEISDEMSSKQRATMFAEEVLVGIEGQERWLPIQASVAPFWRRELAEGEAVWLYVSRFGCVKPVDAAGDRTIMTINEFQVEPIGQPEPTP